MFSFGVILSEMMARHVVDSQHFQRIPPDMCISPDEILFRAQTGCPLELGELAIHCVQFQPYNRPKLQNIVERLTAIENVDIHVGTTLLVAPSVARAARNMMRKRDAETTRNQPPPNPFLDPESQFQHPSSIYRSGGTVRAHRSSIIDETEIWRMTDPENRDSDLDSQDTFKAGRRPWKGDSQDSRTSKVPLVMEERYQARRQYKSSQGNNTSDDASTIRRRGDGEEEPTFRMPMWDTINSPGHQGWSGSESVRISTIDGDQDEASLQSWDQERYPPAPSMQYVRHETDSVRLSSIQLDIRDDDEEEDEFFEQGSGFLSGSSDEDDSDDSLFDEDSENDNLMPGMTGHAQGRAGPGQAYELSSDSDGSSVADTDSVTESVVLALDTLEIPDHANKHAKKAPPVENVRPPNPEPSPPATSPSESPLVSPRIGNNLFRQPSLISRLLPPTSALENLWGTPRQSPPPGVAQVLVHTSDHEDEPDGSSKLIAKLASATVRKLDGHLEDEPLGSKAPEMLELPPAPPSKSSSLLMRTNTWKATQTHQLSQEQSNGLVSPALDDIPSGVSATGSISTSTFSLADLGSSSSSTSLPSNPDDLPLSSTATSSSDKDISEDPEPESRTTTATNTLRSISPSPRKPSGPRDRPNSPSPPGLIRGMSDSFWSKSHSSAEAVNTLTSTMVMNARTWTGSTAFGTWIGGAPSSSTAGAEGTTSGTSTAKNTLKMPTISIKEEEDGKNAHDAALDQEKESEKEQEKEAGEETKLYLVKKRSIKRTLTKAVSSPHVMALTGISHRFSLVAFSALMLPKCDVCQKRIGVLPGWSSKHLECDGNAQFFCLFVCLIVFFPRLLTY